MPNSPVFFYCLNLSLLPGHLSINLLREPLLSPGPTTIFSISKAPTYLGLSLLCAPHLFLALSYLLVSEASFSLSLSLLCLSTFSLISWISCSARLFFPPHSLSYLPCTPFPCILISVGLSCLSLSPCAPYLSIPCLHNSFLASNLFMFSLVPL